MTGMQGEKKGRSKRITNYMKVGGNSIKKRERYRKEDRNETDRQTKKWG